MALKRRVIGVETEYGIVGGSSEEVVSSHRGRKKNHFNLSLTNISAVDGFTDYTRVRVGDYAHDTSSSNDNSMIENGGRFYVDMGHPEYCTPEVTNPYDLVVFDKAGERIVYNAAENVGNTKIIKNNSDGKGNSFGCHENYLIERFSSDDFKNILARHLIPFFVTRQLFTGSGKVGVERSKVRHWYNRYSDDEKIDPFWNHLERGEKRIRDEVNNLASSFLDIPDFYSIGELLNDLFEKRKKLGIPKIYQISQRADFFEELMGLQTTFDRPIINTRDEPHADNEKYMRLHVICGDANMSEVATYLKFGTTSLVLDLIEDGLAPKITLEDPVIQRKALSRDQKRKWILSLENGNTISAIDVQRTYLDVAKINYVGRNNRTNDILKRWENTLDSLERNPMELSNSIDWVIKLNLLTKIMERKNVELNDTIIKETAFKYHDIDPKGIFYSLQNKGLIERIVNDDEIKRAISNPPTNTRAYLRGEVVKRNDVSKIDWGGFTMKIDDKLIKVILNEPLAGNQIDLLSFEENISGKNFLKILKEIKGIEVDDQ